MRCRRRRYGRQRSLGVGFVDCLALGRLLFVHGRRDIDVSFSSITAADLSPQAGLFDRLSVPDAIGPELHGSPIHAGPRLRSR